MGQEHPFVVPGCCSRIRSRFHEDLCAGTMDRFFPGKPSSKPLCRYNQLRSLSSMNIKMPKRQRTSMPVLCLISTMSFFYFQCFPFLFGIAGILRQVRIQAQLICRNRKQLAVIRGCRFEFPGIIKLTKAYKVLSAVVFPCQLASAFG